MTGMTCCDINDFLQAMASETRQRILALLCERKLTVNELTQLLPVEQPTVSHHLALLRRANLVLVRRSGRRRIYRVNPVCVVECCSEILDRFTMLSWKGASDGS